MTQKYRSELVRYIGIPIAAFFGWFFWKLLCITEGTTLEPLMAGCMLVVPGIIIHETTLYFDTFGFLKRKITGD